jgi:hypothetical protein
MENCLQPFLKRIKPFLMSYYRANFITGMRIPLFAASGEPSLFVTLTSPWRNPKEWAPLNRMIQAVYRQCNSLGTKSNDYSLERAKEWQKVTAWHKYFWGVLVLYQIVLVICNFCRRSCSVL